MSNPPKGHFPRFLTMDAETSGLSFDSYDPSFHQGTNKRYQSVSWGLIAVDSATMKPIDELYVEIKHDPKYMWNDSAEKIHGLSIDYLEANGLSELEAVEKIGSFIFEHFGDMPRVPCAGHNVSSFDIHFMRSLLGPYDIMFNTGSRFIDTSTLGFVCYNAFTSDQLFEMINVHRTAHNALEDARASLKVIQTTRTLFNSILG